MCHDEHAANMEQGKQDKTRGIIIAGWGNVDRSETLHTLHTVNCHHLSHASRNVIIEQCLQQAEIDQLRMSFTKQLLSGKSQPRRKPVLVSRTRSDPWIPAGTNTRQDRVKSRSAIAREPFCSVCVNDNLTEADVEVRRELDREVRLLQSKPSIAYKKHSPRNWSQDTLLDDVRTCSRQQQKRLKDLKKEYEEIESKCKTKLIDDLAGLYYKNELIRQNAHDDEGAKTQKKLIQSRSINIEILDDGSVRTSKVIRSKSGAKSSQLEDDEDSLDKSITISINSKSSRRSQKQSQHSKNANEAAKKTKESLQDDVVDGNDDEDDCDTLNAIDNISVHDDSAASNSQLVHENTNIKAENEALRKKYRKYKILKNKIAQSDADNSSLKKDIETLKLDLGRLLKENTELRLRSSVAADSESRRLQRQDSIHEAPVRDSQDQGVQVKMANNDKHGSNFSSVEVDYFTEVIIDELKKEIRELKNQNQTAAQHNQEHLKVKEDSILTKLSKLKTASEVTRNEVAKSREECSNSSDIEKMKVEVENLKKMLLQERETNATFESYIELLKNSYTTMFGPLDSK